MLTFINSIGSMAPSGIRQRTSGKTLTDIFEKWCAYWCQEGHSCTSVLDNHILWSHCLLESIGTWVLKHLLIGKEAFSSTSHMSWRNLAKKKTRKRRPNRRSNRDRKSETNESSHYVGTYHLRYSTLPKGTCMKVQEQVLDNSLTCSFHGEDQQHESTLRVMDHLYIKVCRWSLGKDNNQTLLLLVA